MHTEADMEDFTVQKMSEKKYRIEIGYIILNQASVFENKYFL